MTLSPPEPALRACVVVPARNEEDLIASCLLALATQRGVEPEAYEVLLVLDDCTDQTEALARETALECPGLRLHFLEGPAEGSGAARRVGMDGARDRLMRVGRPDGLIACTDADTVVAKDWISAQLRAVSNSPTTGRCPRASGPNTQNEDACATSGFSRSRTAPGNRSTGSSRAPPSP